MSISVSFLLSYIFHLIVQMKLNNIRLGKSFILFSAHLYDLIVSWFPINYVRFFSLFIFTNKQTKQKIIILICIVFRICAMNRC